MTLTWPLQCGPIDVCPVCGNAGRIELIEGQDIHDETGIVIESDVTAHIVHDTTQPYFVSDYPTGEGHQITIPATITHLIRLRTP